MSNDTTEVAFQEGIPRGRRRIQQQQLGTKIPNRKLKISQALDTCLNFNLLPILFTLYFPAHVCGARVSTSSPITWPSKLATMSFVAAILTASQPALHPHVSSVIEVFEFDVRSSGISGNQPTLTTLFPLGLFSLFPAASPT